MKKIICLFLSFNLAFANLENFNVGTWNLQGSSAATESKWSVSVRQLVSGANPLDILMIQEAGTLPRTATPTGRHVQQGGTPIDEYEWNLGTLSRPDRVFIYYSRVDVGANRVNLAIVSRMQAEEVIVLPPPTTVSRPIIGIRNGNDAFFNIHALANGGTDVGAIITAVDAHFANMPQVNWMIAGDFNRDPSTITSTVDRELANRIRVVFPTSATQASGGTLDYAITGNSNRQQTYTPPLLAAIITLAFATPTGDLKDFTEMVSIRSLETGIFLSAFRDTSKDPIDQNWNIKEIVLSDELKQKDKLADELPFGYVQFTNPKESDLCLAILEDGTFGAKSCQDDLKDGKLETVFSIMPTTTSAVQIRSLVLESDECIVTFFNPNIPIQKRFGIAPCTLDPIFFAEVNELMIITPPLTAATPLE